jgi:hypothetical protein
MHCSGTKKRILDVANALSLANRVRTWVNNDLFTYRLGGENHDDLFDVGLYLIPFHALLGDPIWEGLAHKARFDRRQHSPL